MSVVVDKVNALNRQLSHLVTSRIQSLPAEPLHSVTSSKYIIELNASLNILSAPRPATPSLDQIARLIIEVNHTKLQEPNEIIQNEYTRELEWLFVARCAVDVYGCLLEQLFQQTLPLAQDIFYWDDILSQPSWRILFLIQTTPYRLWRFGTAAWTNVQTRLRDPHTHFSLGTLRSSLFDRNLFRRIAFPTRLPGSLSAIDSSLDSLCRHEIETKLSRLKALRALQAAGLGLLVSEGIDFASSGDDAWKERVVGGVDVMKLTMEWLQNVDVQSEEIDMLDEKLSHLRAVPVLDLAAVTTNLLNLAQNILPNQDTHTSTLVALYGRPSTITRYWPLGATILFSGSTILRLLFNNKENIISWIQDSYTTVIDFWQNWVVKPITDIISTIRHDESSQIALMSRQSLQADMDSLERMVVEFAKDNTQYLPSSPASPASINSTATAPPKVEDALEIVRKGVRQGDLSPVLLAYEADLRTPLRSAVTGNLIRTLLIQVQKTKVDVEFALSGIDQLLKSQQLVFAFVGITPSLIILYVFLRWASELPSRRRGLRQGAVKSDMVKTLRNIERILCLHDAQRGDVLTYQDRGLLLCDCYVIARLSVGLPRSVRKEFMQDLGDLEDVTLGVDRQLKTVGRIWRVWGKYLV